MNREGNNEMWTGNNSDVYVFYDENSSSCRMSRSVTPWGSQFFASMSSMSSSITRVVNLPHLHQEIPLKWLVWTERFIYTLY